MSRSLSAETYLRDETLFAENSFATLTLADQTVFELIQVLIVYFQNFSKFFGYTISEKIHTAFTKVYFFAQM